MLGSITKGMEISTVRVNYVNGEFGMEVNVTKVDKGEMLNVNNSNYKYNERISAHKHLNDLEMEENETTRAFNSGSR